MFLRLFGWLLMGMAFIAASAEAVLALNTGTQSGLVAGEVWTLLSGQPLHAFTADAGTPWVSILVRMVMDLPAWLAVGLVGLSLLVVGRLGRPRPRSRAFG